MNRFKMNVVNCAMLGAFEGTGIEQLLSCDLPNVFFYIA